MKVKYGYLISLIAVSSVLFLACDGGAKDVESSQPVYSLTDFYQSNPALDSMVDAIFDGLDSDARLGQMIVTSAGTTGKPASVVRKLIRQKAIGGVLLLSGEKDELIKLRKEFDSLSNVAGIPPLIFSSDAEPSLINRKIKGTTPVPKTINLTSQAESDSIARIIADELLSIGIKQNFAPVLDMSPDNEAITNRTFGADSSSVVERSLAFVAATQEKGLAATVKHFPGHGLVQGDTHSQLVMIDGKMKEVNHYIPLISNGAIGVMVGHIAVKNNDSYNTEGLPSSCSRAIVTDLLKEKLGFKGLVITDAMNMGALRKIDRASLKSVQAGIDMVLMEPNELQLHEDMKSLYMQDESFKAQVDASVRKIIRLKICLGLY